MNSWLWTFVISLLLVGPVWLDTVVVGNEVELVQGTNYYFNIKSNIVVLSGETSSFKVDSNDDILENCKVQSNKVFTKDNTTLVADEIDCGDKDYSNLEVVLSLGPSYTSTVIVASLLSGYVSNLNLYASIVIYCDDNVSISNVTVQENAKLIVSAYFGQMDGNSIEVHGWAYFDALDGNFTSVTNHPYQPPLGAEVQDQGNTFPQFSSFRQTGEGSWGISGLVDKTVFSGSFTSPLSSIKPLMGIFMLRQSFHTVGLSPNTTLVFSGNHRVSDCTFNGEVLIMGGNSTFRNSSFTTLTLDGTLITSKDLHLVTLQDVSAIDISSLDYSIKTASTTVTNIYASGIGEMTLDSTVVSGYLYAETDIEITNSTLNSVNAPGPSSATYINISGSTANTLAVFSNGPDITLKNLNIADNIEYQNLGFDSSRIPTLSMDGVSMARLTSSCIVGCSSHIQFLFNNMVIPVGDSPSLFTRIFNESTGEITASLVYSPSGTSFSIVNSTFQEGITKLAIDFNNLFRGNKVEIINCQGFSSTINITTDYNAAIYGTIPHPASDIISDAVVLKNTQPVTLTITYLNYPYANNAVDTSVLYLIDDGLTLEFEDVELTKGLNITHRNVNVSARNTVFNGDINIQTYNQMNTVPPLYIKSVTVLDNFTFSGGSLSIDGNRGNNDNRIESLLFKGQNEKTIDITMRNSCLSLMDTQPDHLRIKCSTSEFTEGLNEKEDGEGDGIPSENSTDYLFENITSNDAVILVSNNVTVSDLISASLTIKTTNSKCTIRDISVESSSAQPQELQGIGANTVSFVLLDSDCSISDVNTRNIKLSATNSSVSFTSTRYLDDEHLAQTNMNLSVLSSQSSLSFSNLLVKNFVIDSKVDSSINIDSSTIHKLTNKSLSDKLLFDGRITSYLSSKGLTITGTSIGQLNELSYGVSDVFLDHAHVNKVDGKIVTSGIAKRTVVHGYSEIGDNVRESNVAGGYMLEDSTVNWNYGSLNNVTHFVDYIPHGMLSDSLSTSDNSSGSGSFDIVSSFLDYKTMLVNAETPIDIVRFESLIEYVIIVDETTAANGLVSYFGAEIPTEQIEQLRKEGKKYFSEAVENQSILLSVIPFIDPPSIDNNGKPITNELLEQYKDYVKCSIELKDNAVVVSCKNNLGNTVVPGDLDKGIKVYGVALAFVPRKGNLSNIDYYINSRHIQIDLDMTPIRSLTIDTKNTSLIPVDIEVNGGYYQNIIVRDDVVSPGTSHSSRSELNNMISFNFIWIDFGNTTVGLDIVTPHSVSISLAPRLYKWMMPIDTAVTTSTTSNSVSTTETANKRVGEPEKCIRIAYSSFDKEEKLLSYKNYIFSGEDFTGVTKETSFTLALDPTSCKESNTITTNVKSGNMTLKVANSTRSSYKDKAAVPYSCSIDIDILGLTNYLGFGPVAFNIGERVEESEIEMVGTGFYEDGDIDGEYLFTSVAYEANSSGEGFYKVLAEGPHDRVNMFINKNHQACAFRFSNRSTTIKTNISGFFSGFTFGLMTFAGNNTLSAFELSATEIMSDSLINFRALSLKSSCDLTLPNASGSIVMVGFPVCVTGNFTVRQHNSRGIVLYRGMPGEDNIANIRGADMDVRSSISGPILRLQNESCSVLKEISVNIDVNGENAVVLLPRFYKYENPATSAAAIAGYVVAGLSTLIVIVVVTVLCVRKKHGKSISCPKRTRANIDGAESKDDNSLIDTQPLSELSNGGSSDEDLISK